MWYCQDDKNDTMVCLSGNLRRRTSWPRSWRRSVVSDTSSFWFLLFFVIWRVVHAKARKAPAPLWWPWQNDICVVLLYTTWLWILSNCINYIKRLYCFWQRLFVFFWEVLNYWFESLEPLELKDSSPLLGHDLVESFGYASYKCSSGLFPLFKTHRAYSGCPDWNDASSAEGTQSPRSGDT